MTAVIGVDVGATKVAAGVVGKTAAILLTFTNGAAHTLTEIVAATGLPPSTAHRLIAQLNACALLERTAQGDYRLGRKVQSIGAVRGLTTTFESLASLLLQELSHALDVEARLGVLTGHDVAFIEKARGPRPVTTFAHGATAPAHATAMGKMLLAFSPPSVVDGFLARGLPAYTPHTIRSHAHFHRALAMAQRSRVAVAWRELEPDRGGLAVPVSDGTGHVVAAIEIRVDNPSAELARVRPTLTVAGRRLSRELSLALPS
jgi:DNA-binding IclR family transcriptional regulator